MDQPHNLNYCIIGPMRSGTSFLFRMIRDFSNDYNSKLNDEYFNILLPNFGITDNGIELINNSNSYLKPHDEILYRINLLKKYNCKYTVKIVADQLNNTILNFLLKNYKIIIIDRKNKYEQYLSLLIAEHSNIWNKGKKFEENLIPFEASLKIANDFFRFEEKWKKDKKYIIKNSTPIKIWYEDFIEDPVNYLKSKNIPVRNFSKFYKPLYKMRNLNQKENLIINLTEIKSLYNKNNAD